MKLSLPKVRSFAPLIMGAAGYLAASASQAQTVDLPDQQSASVDITGAALFAQTKLAGVMLRADVETVIQKFDHMDTRKFVEANWAVDDAFAVIGQYQDYCETLPKGTTALASCLHKTNEFLDAANLMNSAIDAASQVDRQQAVPMLVRQLKKTLALGL